MFAWLPPELSLLSQKVRVEILGNWYGEKQAGKIWNDLFHAVLVEMGFIQCPVFLCLYIWRDKKDAKIFLTIHVDDGMFISNDRSLANEFLEQLLRSVRKAVIYENFKKYVGMDISFSVDRNLVFVNQTKYITEYFPNNSRRMHTPMRINEHLRKEKPNSSNMSLLPDTGKFRWLADRTRPDILVAVGEISSGGAVNPSDKHMLASEHLKHYLTFTKDFNLTLGGNDDEVVLYGYSDASYITGEKSRSRLGGCLFLSKRAGAIHSYSTLDSLVSHSSTEAEIKAIDKLCREVVFLREVLKFMGYEQVNPTIIYVDNKSAIEICKTLKMTRKTKHINMRINYIRELINARVIELHFVRSELNVADVLTKPLCRDPHVRHTKVLLHGHNGVCPIDINNGSLAFCYVPEYIEEEMIVDVDDNS